MTRNIRMRSGSCLCEQIRNWCAVPLGVCESAARESSRPLWPVDSSVLNLHPEKQFSEVIFITSHEVWHEQPNNYVQIRILPTFFIIPLRFQHFHLQLCESLSLLSQQDFFFILRAIRETNILVIIKRLQTCNNYNTWRDFEKMGSSVLKIHFSKQYQVTVVTPEASFLL